MAFENYLYNFESKQHNTCKATRNIKYSLLYLSRSWSLWFNLCITRDAWYKMKFVRNQDDRWLNSRYRKGKKKYQGNIIWCTHIYINWEITDRRNFGSKIRHTLLLAPLSSRTSSDSLAISRAIFFAAAIMSLSFDDHCFTSWWRSCAAIYVSETRNVRECTLNFATRNTSQAIYDR